MQTSPELLKRLALGVIGQALPKASALSGMVQHVRRGLLATVVTGVLFSALLLLGCFSFYQFLLQSNISQAVALSFSAVLLFLLTITSGLVAEKYISKAAQQKQKLEIFPENNLKSAVDLEHLFQAFVNGLYEKDQPTPKNEGSYDHATHSPQCRSSVRN